MAGKTNQNQDKRVLNYVNGLLHYYGVIEKQELLSLVRANLKLEITGQEFEKIIDRGFKEYGNELFFERNELFYFNIEVDDIGELLKEQASHNQLSFRPVAEKDVQGISRFMLKTTRDRYAKRIIKFLSQSGLPPEEIAEHLYNTIADYNNGVEHLELLKRFFREVDFKSEKELNTFADNLAQFLNKTPLWDFKGWTSEEMGKKRKEQEQQNQANLKPFVTTPDAHDSEPQSSVSGNEPAIIEKVGRNEPCPCGSGKKYKKCCGNNQGPGYEILQTAQPGQEQQGAAKERTELSPEKATNAGQSREKPSLKELNKLYFKALRIRDGHFWEWMNEVDIFGVENPETGEIAYCSFMGALGEVFALNAYLGPEGLQSYFNFQHLASIDSNADPQDIKDGYFMLKCLSISFEDRDQLDKKDLATIKDLDLKIRGKKQWPQFRSYQPRHYPWHLTAAEVRFFNRVLEEAINVALACREDKSVLSTPEEGEMLVRARKVSGGKEYWVNSYRVLEDYEQSYLTYGITDEIMLRNILKHARREETIWEADISLALTPVQDNKNQRPYFPSMFLLIDCSTELIIQYDLIEDIENESYRIIDRLLSAIKSTKVIPKSIAVSKEETYQYLKRACEQLAIELLYVEKLKFAPSIKEDLNQSFS